MRPPVGCVRGPPFSSRPEARATGGSWSDRRRCAPTHR
jgi:hypothetical protein